MHAALSLFKADKWRSVAAPFYERRNLPERIQAHRNDRSLAVGDQRPGELFVPEILGDRQGENAPLAARQKVSRLPLIRPARLDPVLRPKRNVQLLLRIPIVIAEEQTVAAVLIPKPPFESAGDALPRLVRRFQRQLLPTHGRAPREQNHE